MKKLSINNIINIILLLVVIGLLATKSNLFQNESTTAPAQQPKDALSIIHSRKSVRNFIKGKEVTNADLTTLIKAGMAAPSAVNKQPWAFIAISDRHILDSLQNILPYAKMLQDASAAIVVCGDMTKAIEGNGRPFWIQDCSAATQNILLAAEAIGLGAVWTGVYPDEDRCKAVSSVLGLPETSIPLNVIPIGHPTGKDQPKNKFKEENIHWQVWNPMGTKE